MEQSSASQCSNRRGHAGKIEGSSEPARKDQGGVTDSPSSVQTKLSHRGSGKLLSELEGLGQGEALFERSMETDPLSSPTRVFDRLFNPLPGFTFSEAWMHRLSYY